MRDTIRATVLFLVLTSLSHAGEIRWAVLEAAVINKRVEMVLPAGGRAEGKVRKVAEDSISLVDAAGERKIPRAGLKSITVHRNGKLWRTVFVAWGGLTILGGAVETGGKGIAAGVGIGLTGYVLGDYLDKRKTVLTLVD